MRRGSSAGLGAAVERIRNGIAKMVGDAPTSCPWRAYGDPVVSAAMRLRRHWQHGAIDVDQQLAVVVDAMLEVDGAQNTIEAMDMRAERERRESDRRMAEAQRR